MGAGEEAGWTMNWDFAHFEEKEIVPDSDLQDQKYIKRESCWLCFIMHPPSTMLTDDSSLKVTFTL